MHWTGWIALISIMIGGFCAIYTGDNFPKEYDDTAPFHARVTLALGKLVVGFCLIIMYALLFM